MDDVRKHELEQTVVNCAKAWWLLRQTTIRVEEIRLCINALTIALNTSISDLVLFEAEEREKEKKGDAGSND